MTEKKISSLIQGTRKMRRIAKALTRRNDKAKLVEINQALYERAYREKLFILGPKKDGIDWSMFDYVVALPAIFNECLSPLDYIKEFWKQVYPHMDKVLDEYEDAIANHNATIAEIDEMMIKYVDMVEEFKIMEEFIGAHEERQNIYKDFKTALKEKIEANAPTRKDVPEQSVEMPS